MNYPSLPISSFCSTGSGGTPSRANVDGYYDGTIPWVKSGELREDIILDTEEKITELALRESSAKLVPKGALLIAMYGATIGRIAELGVDGTTNQAVCHIVPDPKVADKRYLFYGLRSKVPELIKQGAGGAQPNINQQIIRDTQIPLPPLPEQKRIAAILDKADAIRRKRQQAVKLTEELLRSVFMDMFGDPVTNPKGWETGNIDTVLRNPKTDLRCGPFGTQLKVHELVNEGIPLFGIESVRNGKFHYKTSKFLTTRKAAELGSFDTKPGDVLVTRMGTIGEACVVPEGVEEARISYHLFRIRTDRNKCLPEFLAATIFQSGTFLVQLKNMAHGAIMDGLSTSNLRDVILLIPPITEQIKYVEVVKKSEKLMESHKETVMASDTLFTSLLQQAFRGERRGVWHTPCWQ